MQRYIFLIFIMYSVQGSAQPMNQADAETMITIAEDRLISEDYYNALHYYERAYQESPDWRLMLQIARMHVELRDYYSATEWYELLLDAHPDELDVDDRFVYAQMLAQSGRSEDASQILDWITKYTKDRNLLQKISVEREGLPLQNKPADPSITVTSAIADINTPFSESSPTITSHGTLVFQSWPQDALFDYADRPKNLKAGLYKSSYRDRINAARQPMATPFEDNTWHTTRYYESQSVPYRLWVRSLLKGNNLDRNEIYIQEKINGTWGAPRKIKRLSDDFLSQHVILELWNNQPTLFYVATLNAGYGGRDIYFSAYLGNGEMGDPINVGAGINTAQDEYSPYVVGSELFFSSQGHPGLGGFDIYKTVWKNNQWSEVTGLDRPINSPQDDYYYILHPEENEGYLVSNRPVGDSFKGPTCCDDIYHIQYVGDSPKQNLVSDETVSDTEDMPIVLLPQVSWKKGFTTFLSESQQDLDGLVETLIQHPTWIIELSVHTDARGDSRRLVPLSQERADIIKNYLVDSGIDADRIQALGYGDQYLLNQCTKNVECTDAEHAINNRAEYVVVDYLNTPQVFENNNKLPLITFQKDTLQLGEVKKGEKKKAAFYFKNTGDAPLLIELVTACTCTTLEWPQYEILPGEEGEISFVYDSTDKSGPQEVTVDILANTEPIITECFFYIDVKE